MLVQKNRNKEGALRYVCWNNNETRAAKMSLNDQTMELKDLNGDEIDYTNEFVVDETPVGELKRY